MIRVYFETDSVSEQVATFESESHYIACLPILKELAKQERWERVTESVEEKVWHNNSVHLSIKIKEINYVSLLYLGNNYVENIITTKWLGVGKLDYEILYRIRIKMNSNFRNGKAREEMLGYMSGGLENIIAEKLYKIWISFKSNRRLRLDRKL